MATGKVDEDAVLTALLTALEDLHNIQTEMNTCIKQGFLNMAKARRSLGRNSVSVHDTREEYSAEVTIDIAHDGEELGLLKTCSAGTIFTRNRRTEGNAVSSTCSDGNLRQRGGAVTQQQSDAEESPMQSDSDVPTRSDSLSLFAGLVPPPLRKSKRNFSSAVDYAVEAANLAHLITSLREQLESLQAGDNSCSTATSS